MAARHCEGVSQGAPPNVFLHVGPHGVRSQTPPGVTPAQGVASTPNPPTSPPADTDSRYQSAVVRSP